MQQWMLFWMLCPAAVLCLLCLPACLLAAAKLYRIARRGCGLYTQVLLESTAAARCCLLQSKQRLAIGVAAAASFLLWASSACLSIKFLFFCCWKIEKNAFSLTMLCYAMLYYVKASNKSLLYFQKNLNLLLLEWAFAISIGIFGMPVKFCIWLPQ